MDDQVTEDQPNLTEEAEKNVLDEGIEKAEKKEAEKNVDEGIEPDKPDDKGTKKVRILCGVVSCYSGMKQNTVKT